MPSGSRQPLHLVLATESAVTPSAVPNTVNVLRQIIVNPHSPPNHRMSGHRLHRHGRCRCFGLCRHSVSRCRFLCHSMYRPLCPLIHAQFRVHSVFSVGPRPSTITKRERRNSKPTQSTDSVLRNGPSSNNRHLVDTRSSPRSTVRLHTFGLDHNHCSGNNRRTVDGIQSKST